MVGGVYNEGKIVFALGAPQEHSYLLPVLSSMLLCTSCAFACQCRLLERELSDIQLFRNSQPDVVLVLSLD